MILDFQQGIISYPSSGNIQRFLAYDVGYVSLTTTDGRIDVAFAHGNKNYLHTESTSINNAWVGIDPTNDAWLYWDIDTLTGTRTFGITYVAPIYGATQPTTPVADQHWFDTTNKKMWRYHSNKWLACIRVFACKINNGVFSPMGSMAGKPYAGTQVGLQYSSVPHGRIMVDDTGAPVRKADGTFITTEDEIFVNGSPVNTIRLEANVLNGTAVESIAKYQVVRFSAFGKVALASYNHIQTTAIAMAMEDLGQGQTGTLCMQGVITNPEWNWKTVGAPLWTHGSIPGLLVEYDPHVEEAGTYKIGKTPIARVLTPTSIFFDQGMGAKGDKGDQGTANVPLATDTIFGISKLSLAATDVNNPIVVGDNDPRNFNDRYPLPHNQAATTITTMPVGILTGSNMQEDLQLINDGFVKRSGDTMTGHLTLSADPANPLHAATKHYVDAMTLGGLGDVTLVSETTGQALLFNGTEWVNGNVSSRLADLTDVELTNLTPNQVLKYNGTEWVNGTAEGGSLWQYSTKDTEYGGDQHVLEPKLTDSAASTEVDQVLIPLHTEIDSNPPSLYQNFWFNETARRNDNDGISTTYVGGVTTVSKQNTPDGPFNLTYAIMYERGRDITIETRIPYGPNSSKRGGPTGWSNCISFCPFIESADTPFVNITIVGASTPFVNITIVGASIATLPDRDEVFVVTCGQYSNGEVSHAISALTSDLRTVLWSKIVYVPNTVMSSVPGSAPNVPAIIIDPTTKRPIVSFPVFVDVIGYASVLEWGAFVMCFDLTGNQVWQQGFFGKRRPTDADSTTWGRFDTYMTQSSISGNIYVSAGETITKFAATTGQPTSGITIQQCNVIDGTTITGLACGGDKLYVAISGFNTHSSKEHGMIVCFEGGEILWNRCICRTYSAWDNELSMYAPAPVKVTCDNDHAYVVCKLAQHGNSEYDGVEAGDVTVIKVTSAGDLVFVTDIVVNRSESSRSPSELTITTRHTEGGSHTGLCVANGSLFFTAALIYRVLLSMDTVFELFAMSTASATVDNRSSTHEFTDSTTIATGSFTWNDHYYVTTTGDSFVMPTIDNTELISASTVGIAEWMATDNGDAYTTYSNGLPPMMGVIVPSLDVINLAKVGALQVGDALAPPTQRIGQTGDQAGMLRFSSEGIWYCESDYDGTTTIWKLAPHDANATPPVSAKPIGYHSSYNLVGSPTDRVGELRKLGTYLFMCIKPYDGFSNIWVRTIHATFNATRFTTTINYSTGDTDDYDTYPSGAVATDAEVTVTPIDTRIVDMWSTYLWEGASAYVYALSPSTNGQQIELSTDGYNFRQGWFCTVINTHATNNLAIVPYSGSGNLIDGLTSVTLPPKASLTIHWTGSAFVTSGRPRNSSMVTLTPGTTVAVNAALSNTFSLTMSGNYTLSNPTNLIDGDTLTFKIYQSGSTARTLSFGTMYKWPGGTIPTVSVGIGKIDIITAKYDASNNQLYCEMVKDMR